MNSRPAIAVVIATKDRPHLLRERALASVAGQTRSPDSVIVVDDSSRELRSMNREFVDTLRIPDCRVAYLENARTEGASGSWNTGIDHVLAEAAAADRVFVAILDDDDAWHPAYLHQCEVAAREAELDMVAADMNRIEGSATPAAVQEAPNELRADAFLVGNPGIQGSNIFARLNVLLAAGGFDEALPSTTDRDLCIRIADLGWVRYGRIPKALVDHYAETDRKRLSTRGSDSKILGLDGFWRKHSGRMSHDQRHAFSHRALTLFGWTAPADPYFPLDPGSPDEQRVALVLGVKATGEDPAHLLEIARVLGGCRDRALVGLNVVLCGNEDRKAEGPYDLRDAAAMLRDAGISTFCFTAERQRDLGAAVLACCTAVAEAGIGSEIWLVAAGFRADGPPGESIATVLRWLGAERMERNDVASHPSSVGAAAAIRRWVTDERIVTAEHRVRRRYSPTRLRLLGCGSEAVVFTDDTRVYKCIDYWKARVPASRIGFLEKQVGRWIDHPGLYALREVTEDGRFVILSYDYEASTPFLGGHEEGMLALLDSCTSAGVVCNNIHPKNLVVTDGGARLIDYGSDIRPWSRLGFEHMARRAFLTCWHAAHPGLPELMRRALSEDGLPELAGYPAFRARAADPPCARRSSRTNAIKEAPPHPPLTLYVGVITSDPRTLVPLVRGLRELAIDPSIARLVLVVLDNASPASELERVIGDARQDGLAVAVVDVDRQMEDVREGRFGGAFRERAASVVGIAAARTMLQRYLGALMAEDGGSFGWVLDDDMRIDERAKAYLRWLPAFRAQGVDVLFGAYEGASPNPPLNGLRVQLVDLFHNLLWLQGLPPAAVLPDRSRENAIVRSRFPDYYYDLSRKHTAHLEFPLWIEPIVDGETVAEARIRLVAEAEGILSGAALTRPILPSMPSDPVSAAVNSVNRGGCTFVLNARALTETPNTITQVDGREARRSDMVWAIVNRHYRGMNVKAVAFPVLHVNRGTGSLRLDVHKVQSEVVGSALYAALTDFLMSVPGHELNFSAQDVLTIQEATVAHRERRLLGLEHSFHRIAGLSRAIRAASRDGELDSMLDHLDGWYSLETYRSICEGVRSHKPHQVGAFLLTLRTVADDYAGRTVHTDFLQAQLRTKGET
jgi:GT2 family glycosyltransferase